MLRRLQTSPGPDAALVLGTLGLVAIVRGLFLITFPLNNLGGDASVYYFGMMLARRSNLILSPGYPFLIGIVPRLITSALPVSDATLAFLVLLAQHVVDLAVCAAMLLALRRSLGPWVASLSVLAYGTSVFALSVTSAAYPEWLQGNLLALTFVCGCVAVRSTGWRHLAGHAGAVLCAAWCFLTKFNAAPFVAFVLLVVFLADVSPLARKARALGLASLLAGLSVAAFVWMHHYPSTGTLALNRDRSWILVQRIAGAFGNDALVRYPTGVAARRWLALAAVLPARYDLAHAFPHVREPGSKAIRSKYRAEFDQIMAMDDAGLKGLLSRRTLPEGFLLEASAVPVSVFVGLAESDDLGVAVYRDFVLHNPGLFAWSVIRESWRSLRSDQPSPIVPLRDSMAAFQLQPLDRRGWGFRAYGPTVSAAPHYRCAYAHGQQADVVDGHPPTFVMWDPGIDLFTALNRLQRVVRPPLWILVLFVAAVGIARIVASGRVSPDTLVALGACAVVVGFVVLSNTIFFFRWKEARFISWPVAVLLALSVAWAIPWVLGQTRRLAGRTRSASNPEPEAR